MQALAVFLMQRIDILEYASPFLVGRRIHGHMQKDGTGATLQNSVKR